MAEEPEERWRTEAEARLASLAKPPGALGTLEDWCVTLCVAQKTFMGRGTARRPVEAPAPTPGFGARANYDPVLDE